MKNGYVSICFLFVCLFFFYNVVENRTQEIEDREEKNLLFILSVTVISKSSRPIGEQKSLGYCKSLDCVAGVLRGIRLIYQQEGNVS